MKTHTSIAWVCTLACMLFMSLGHQARGQQNQLSFAASVTSPLNPYPGFITTNYDIVDPAIFGPLQWENGHGNRLGHLEFEIANGFYALLVLDIGDFGFVENQKYLNPLVAPAASEKTGQPGMMFYGLGRGYLSLYDDSYFQFNHLEFALDGTTITSFELEIYQHGCGWNPYYSDGQEWAIISYNLPMDMTPTSALSLACVPEPTIGTLGLIGGIVLAIRRRR
ncbi:MAG: hypothetical protein KBC33_00180 [Candidatus Pacebacteria bacterium]|nr:hypothetical protein [Candidatus Paceibacterota bacterium]